MAKNTQTLSIATRTRIAYWRSVASDPTVAMTLRADARTEVRALVALNQKS